MGDVRKAKRLLSTCWEASLWHECFDPQTCLDIPACCFLSSPLLPFWSCAAVLIYFFSRQNWGSVL